MEFYTCEYCYKEFNPKRRRVQKYCSNTCRSKAHHARKKTENKLATNPDKETKIEVATTPVLPKKTKVEAMSLSGTGNAAAGSLLADGLKSMLTPIENKAATKGDLENLKKQLLNRYFKINNLAPRHDGALPYFDIDTGDVFYSFFNL
ncbi:hypothetical protein [Algibacter sp. L4_22]|uniref:hypothetical protein n=1 Tax=Algibacter sp. L4_22 TaxID=2942477 RepID=UPI00201B5FAA|nr:hypothetical protein [Algibacter sp. L4_22]